MTTTTGNQDPLPRYQLILPSAVTTIQRTNNNKMDEKVSAQRCCSQCLGTSPRPYLQWIIYYLFPYLFSSLFWQTYIRLRPDWVQYLPPLAPPPKQGSGIKSFKCINIFIKRVMSGCKITNPADPSIHHCESHQQLAMHG